MAGRRNQRTFDASMKAEALSVADKVGSAEASRRTGVPANTIRSWRHRGGGAGPPKGADPVDWASRKQAGAEDAWETAQEALAQVRSLLAEGQTADAQRAALTMAILTDKSGVLEEAARREEDRLVRIAEGQAQLLVAVIERYFEAVGLTLGPVARQTLAHLLRQAKVALRCRRRPRRRGRSARSESAWGRSLAMCRRCCRLRRDAAGFGPQRQTTEEGEAGRDSHRTAARSRG